MGKKDNMILIALLTSILALVVSVFSVNQLFLKELMLLALLVVCSIAIFYGIITNKVWVNFFAMVVFAAGIANGFFMQMTTHALLAYLLIITNLLGFIFVMQSIEKPAKQKKPEQSEQKEPEILIKEIKPEELRKQATARLQKHRKRAGKKKSKMTEAELLRTEEEILKELDKAIAEKSTSIEQRMAASGTARRPPRQDNRLNEYYDSDNGAEIEYAEEENRPARNGKAVPTREIDDFVKSLKEFEGEVGKAKGKKAKKRR